MDKLEILRAIALNYTGFVSNKKNNMSILKKAMENVNLDVVNVLLSYRSKLGRALYVVPDQSYPNYVIADMNLVPVFITAVLNSSENIFERILEETTHDFALNPSDNYWLVNYKINTLISSLSMIDLTRYIQHEDFNPFIFSKILSIKIELDKMIHYLEIRKMHFELETGVPMLRTPEGVDLSSSLNRNLLWSGSLKAVPIDGKSDDLNITGVLHRLFYTAISAHNYQAAVLILCEYFNNEYINDLDKIILEQKNKTIKNVICNFLLLQAIKGQNSSLIEFLAKHTFDLKKDIFKEISDMKDSQSLVFTAKELFHNLHVNNFAYEPQSVKIILDKILLITKNNKEDKSLGETISLFVNEIRQFTLKNKDNRFFVKLMKDEKIERMLDEIDQLNITYVSPNLM